MEILKTVKEFILRLTKGGLQSGLFLSKLHLDHVGTKLCQSKALMVKCDRNPKSFEKSYQP